MADQMTVRRICTCTGPGAGNALLDVQHEVHGEVTPMEPQMVLLILNLLTISRDASRSCLGRNLLLSEQAVVGTMHVHL